MSKSDTVPVSFWSPFKNKVFVAIWLAAIASDLGLWMQNVGASWIITTETSNPLFVTLMVTATSLPMFLLGLPAGALADIFNKRKILLATQLWLVGISVILTVVSFMGITPPLLLLILSFLLVLGPATNAPIWQSVIPELVSSENLSAAITLKGVSVNFARALGPAIAGFMISSLHPGFVFLLNAICFSITFGIVFFWEGTKSATTLQSERFISAIRIGYNYVRYSKKIHPVYINSFFFTFGASALFGLLPILVIQEMQRSAQVYGTILFTMGTGALFGAMVMPFLNTHLNLNQRVVLSGVAFIASLSILTLSSNVYVYGGVLFLSGFAWLFALTGFNVAIQTNVPRWVLSRSIAIFILVFQGGMAVGGIVWGTVASKFTTDVALYSAAIWIGLSLVLLLRFSLKHIATGDYTPLLEDTIVPKDIEITNDEGPVLVLIEYDIKQKDIKKFTNATEELQELRMRNGASKVGVFQDVAQPQLITEFFIVESWLEYQLQHSRYTKDDLALEEKAAQYHSGKKAPARKVLINQAFA